MPITPSDSPSAPAQYDAVTPAGTAPRPAPYDIQAPSPLAECQAAFDQAIAAGGSGVLYPMSPRIAEARALLDSPQGSPEMDVSSGAATGWPTDVEPPAGYETPLIPGPHGG
jgi:hypothetical protein